MAASELHGQGNPKAASALHDSNSLKSHAAETELFRERLRSSGVLGIQHPVRIRGEAASEEGACQPLAAGEKRVHFIRHGQGFHNLLSDLYREMGRKFDAQSGAGGSSNPYRRPEVLDSPLTEIGRQQARALQPTARKLAPQLVVVSTLTRATQTGLIAFAHLTDGLKTKVPFVAHDGCHEIAGVHTCDKRRSLTELSQDFPQVDYSQTGLPEEDPFWSEEDRETLPQLASRAFDFMIWLRDRPENEVAVVAHFAWLMTLLNGVVECSEPQLSTGFHTGELRSLVLRFEERNGAGDAVVNGASKRQRTS